MDANQINMFNFFAYFQRRALDAESTQFVRKSTQHYATVRDAYASVRYPTPDLRIRMQPYACYTQSYLMIFCLCYYNSPLLFQQQRCILRLDSRQEWIERQKIKHMKNSRASAPAVSLNGLQHGEIACEMCYVHDNAPLVGKQGAIIHHLARQYYL